MKKTLFNALILILFCVALLVSCGDARAETEVSQTTDAPEPSPTSVNCKHAFGVWEVIRVATCREDGEVYRTCEKCGYTERESTLKPDHWYVDNVCDLCGDIRGASSLCPHNFSVWITTKEAKCISDGEMQRYCSICGQLDKKILPLTGEHKLETLPERAPTCYVEGCTEHIYCVYCNLVFKQRQYFEKIPHKIAVEAAVEPTCQLSGWTEGQHCYVCRDTVTRRTIIPRVDHRYKDGICMVCGISERDAKIKKASEACERSINKEHVIEKWFIYSMPTCQKEGKIRGYCSMCNNHVDVNSQKIPHVYYDGFCIMCKG